MARGDEKYPEGYEYEGGCKVSWLWYTDKALAEQASEIARRNARLQEARGYDFGYCCPGTIETLNKDGMVKYRVCIP